MFSNRKKFKIQGYTKSHKKSLMTSQVIELIRNERIKTTPTKAKALKKEFDKLVTTQKKGTPSSVRTVKAFFNNNERSISRLNEIVDKYLNDRNSGYTRVIKTLPRKGDNAEQVYVMLVNAEFKEKESKLKEILEKQDKKAKSARGSKAKKVEAVKENKNTGRKTVTKTVEKRRNSK